MDAGVEHGAELAEFGSAADQRMGLRGRASDSCRSPGLDGNSYPLQSQRSKRLVGNYVIGGFIDVTGNQRFAADGLFQQPRGNVGGFAGDGIAAMVPASDRTPKSLNRSDADVEHPTASHA